MILAKYDNFLFDLDGTLIDSFGDIQHALLRSYRKVLRQEVMITRSHIGPPLVEMIDVITPGLEVAKKDEVIREFRKEYDHSDYGMTFETEGAMNLLKHLKSCGKDLYLVTNKAFLPTQNILRKLDIDFFRDVITPDKMNGKRLTKSELIGFLIKNYSMDIARTVMIGDAAQDAMAAGDNSIDSISITGGYDSKENLVQANPTFMVGGLSDLHTKL